MDTKEEKLAKRCMEQLKEISRLSDTCNSISYENLSSIVGEEWKTECVEQELGNGLLEHMSAMIYHIDRELRECIARQKCLKTKTTDWNI